MYHWDYSTVFIKFASSKEADSEIRELFMMYKFYIYLEEIRLRRNRRIKFRMVENQIKRYLMVKSHLMLLLKDLFEVSERNKD